MDVAPNAHASVGYSRMTLALYRRRAFRKEFARAGCSGALSIQRLEGSPPRLRWMRALCKFNRVKERRRAGSRLCRRARHVTALFHWARRSLLGDVGVKTKHVLRKGCRQFTQNRFSGPTNLLMLRLRRSAKRLCRAYAKSRRTGRPTE